MDCNNQNRYDSGNNYIQFPGSRYPVAMGYVPMQEWEAPYPLDHALMRGTSFAALDYPFMMGRCR